METARKRPGSRADGEESRNTRAKVDREVTDGEVEEFFAILRRMYDPQRCRLSREVKGGARWKLEFRWEDFQVSIAGKEAKLGEEAVTAEERPAAEDGIPRRLDLNTEPEPEPE